MSSESDAEKKNGQSVFSARSGIQDPLIKAPAEPEQEPKEPAEEAESEAAPPTQPEEETEPATPGKKPRKGKGDIKKGEPKRGKKLARSKRQLDRARQRQENYLQKRRKEKKLKVFYGRIKAILKLCFALLWGILLWEMAHSSLWLLHSPQFSVENERILQSSQLTPLVKPWVGKPLYAIDTGKLAHQIEDRFELVEQAVVRRQLFPASLDIQVFEKKPWAELYSPAAYDKSQKRQKELDKEAEQTGKAAPKVTIRPYGVAAGDELISLSDYQYQSKLYPQAEKILVNPKTPMKQAYLKQLREIAWQARQIKGLHLETVDVRNLNQVVLRYREIPVILGKLNQGASERLARLIPLLPKMWEYRDVIESVDLQWEEQVTFHQRPDAKLKPPLDKSQAEQVRG